MFLPTASWAATNRWRPTNRPGRMTGKLGSRGSLSQSRSRSYAASSAFLPFCQAVSFLHVVHERLFNLPLLLIPPVEDHAITERERIAFLHRVIAALFALRKVMQPPRIGRKQPVRPNVPMRRIPEARRMIQDRDAQGLAANRA